VGCREGEGERERGKREGNKGRDKGTGGKGGEMGDSPYPP